VTLQPGPDAASCYNDESAPAIRGRRHYVKKVAAQRCITVNILHFRKDKREILSLQNLLTRVIQSTGNRSILADDTVRQYIASPLRQRVVEDRNPKAARDASKQLKGSIPFVGSQRNEWDSRLQVLQKSLATGLEVGHGQ
jgi:hypothetical protein